MILIHEMTADGRHRIVAVGDNGLNETGEWVETRALATFQKYFANADASSLLPPGIFTVKEASYQALV